MKTKKMKKMSIVNIKERLIGGILIMCCDIKALLNYVDGESDLLMIIINSILLDSGGCCRRKMENE